MGIVRWCRVGKTATPSKDDLRQTGTGYPRDLRALARSMRSKLSAQVRDAKAWGVRAEAAELAGQGGLARQALERRDEALREARAFARSLHELRTEASSAPASLEVIEQEIRTMSQECQTMVRELEGLTREARALAIDQE